MIVGGGTAGWLTAAYLARVLGADLPGGLRITLVESEDIGILGVGEGTFPTIRGTLARIGVREVDLLRRCNAVFKQGARFIGWRHGGTSVDGDDYLHAFQAADDSSGPELLPYWLAGAAGNVSWDAAATPQRAAVEADRGPKLASHGEYAGPLAYAYHFDAPALAVLLREQGIANGVAHVVDTLRQVHCDETGAIAGLDFERSGRLTADLYIDCTGFRAELIGKAMGMPWHSCRDHLFCDSALAMQVPYPAPDAPLASATVATAKPAGWTWDIGLTNRRGVGHVYSSAHMDRDEAERILRAHVGPAADKLDVRAFRFEAGYRQINWHRNCVAIGLSSGFFEPLEATGIVFSEVAASLVTNLFPWGGDLETSARQFNAIMLRRYERARDFIKLHYLLSRREDHAFWRDNRDAATAPDSLLAQLECWRHRPPNELDIDPNVDIFGAASWQYVLYGMGWQTDLAARTGAMRLGDQARTAFATLRQHAAYARTNLPSNRALVNQMIGNPAR